MLNWTPRPGLRSRRNLTGAACWVGIRSVHASHPRGPSPKVAAIANPARLVVRVTIHAAASASSLPQKSPDPTTRRGAHYLPERLKRPGSRHRLKCPCSQSPSPGLREALIDLAQATKRCLHPRLGHSPPAPTCQQPRRPTIPRAGAWFQSTPRFHRSNPAVASGTPGGAHPYKSPLMAWNRCLPRDHPQFFRAPHRT